MNDVKYELFKLALTKSEDEIKNAVDVTKNLLVFLEVEKPVEIKNQRPIIDVINEKIESDKTLKDPLVKEYNRHRLISDYINNELKVGIEKLCLDIDKKLGVSAPKEFCTDQLSKIFMESLEVDGDKCRMSSKGYESPFVEEEHKHKQHTKSKTILTGIEEKDKDIISELKEKYEDDIKASNNDIKRKGYNTFFPSYPPGKMAKTNITKSLNVANEPKIFDLKKEQKNVFETMHQIISDPEPTP